MICSKRDCCKASRRHCLSWCSDIQKTWKRSQLSQHYREVTVASQSQQKHGASLALSLRVCQATPCILAQRMRGAIRRFTNPPFLPIELFYLKRHAQIFGDLCQVLDHWLRSPTVTDLPTHASIHRS